MPNRSRISITPFKGWTFGLAIAATAGVVAILATSHAYNGDITDEPLMWVVVLAAAISWIGALTAIVRDAILVKLEDIAKAQECAQCRCQLVQHRLDEIEQELAGADQAAIAAARGRRLYPVE